MKTILITPQTTDNEHRTQRAAAPIIEAWEDSGLPFDRGYPVNSEERDAVHMWGEGAVIHWRNDTLPRKLDKYLPTDLPEGTHAYLNYEPHEHQITRLWTHGDDPARAADFMRRALAVCKRERPDLKWSHWGSPKLWDTGLPPASWMDNARRVIGSGFFREHGWIGPSINTGLRAGKSPDVSLTSIRMRIGLGITRIRTTDHSTPVIPSLWPRHGPHSQWPNQFIPNADLEVMLDTIARSGVEHMVFWQSVNDDATAMQTAKYLRKRYLPRLARVLRMYGGG